MNIKLKRPFKLYAFALTALLSPAICNAQRNHTHTQSLYIHDSANAEYQKIFALGQQAAEVAAKVGVAQVTLNSSQLKKAYQKKAAHKCVEGTVYALENLDLSELLKDLGWFQRKIVEAKVADVIYKLRSIPAPSLSRKRLNQLQKEMLDESYKFGKYAIGASVDIGLSLGIISDEQKRKEFGKRFATEFTAGVESALHSIDIKAIAEKHQVTIADDQLEKVKSDMRSQIKRMRETIESGALGEFFALQQQ